MEGLVILVLSVLAIILIVPFVALARANSASSQISGLEARIRILERKIADLLASPAPPRQADERSRAPMQYEISRPVVAETPAAPKVEELFVSEEPVIPEEPEIPAEPEMPAAPEVPDLPEIEEVDEEEEAPAVAAMESDEWVDVLYGEPAAEPRVETPAAAPRPARTGQSWEMYMGGTLFNRIAVVAIIIGVASLLMYAFKEHMITPWMLVSSGFVAGIGLLFLGSYFHRKEIPIFAQGLVGAGIAILYLSAYASFNLYHLVLQPTALILLSVTTAIAVVQAFRYDSLAVSLMGLTGGFLTPLLLSAGESAGGGNTALGLFIYVAVLDVGLLAVAMKKDSWAIMELLTLAGTYLTFFVWHDKYYEPSMIGTTVPFLVVAWALFYALDIFRVMRRTSTYTDLRVIVPIANSAAFYAGMYMDINPQHHEWMGFVTLLIALTYFVTVLVLIRRHADSLVSIPRYILTAIALLVIATGIQFNGFTQVTLWSLEAAALAWCGTHWRARYVWLPALFLFGAAISTMLAERSTFGYTPLSEFRLILNGRFLAYVVMAASLAFSAWRFRRMGDDNGRLLSIWMNCIWSFILLTGLGIEVNDLFRKLMAADPHGRLHETYELHRSLALAVVWTTYSLPLIWVGLRKRAAEVTTCGLLITAIGVVVAAIGAIAAVERVPLTPIANYRAVTLVFLIAVMFMERYWLGRRREEYPWGAGMTYLLDVAISLLGLELLTVETLAYFNRFMSAPETWKLSTPIALFRQLTVMLFWALYSLPLVWSGLRRNLRVYTSIGLSSLALAVGVVVIASLVTLDDKPLAPFINYRSVVFAAVIGIVLIQQHLIGRRSEELPWASGAMEVFNLTTSMLGFELITVEILAYFFRFDTGALKWNAAISLELAQVLALAIAWAVYSVPIVRQGLRRSSNTLLVVGLGSLILGVAYLAAYAYAYEPAKRFALLLNPRAAAYVAGAIIMLIQYRMLTRRSDEYSWVSIAQPILRIAISLFIFELLTVETWDYYRRAIELTGGSAHHGQLADSRQAALSVVWVVYSILLMGFGIWRRVPLLRFVALALFVITILKVFFFDLSHLDTLYRIFSFIGLGLILLATSYLYQRFKSIIVGPAESSDEASA